MDNKPPRRPMPRKQFFDDIVRPGRTPASPTSRPVLPSNHPPVQDTSMKPNTPSVPGAPPQSTPSSQPPFTQRTPTAQPVQSVPTPTPSVATPAPVRPAPAPPQPVQPQIPAAQSHPAPGQSPEAHVTEPQRDATPHRGRHSIWSEVLAIAAIVLLIGIILNILVDADVLNLPIPHTNFFDY